MNNERVPELVGFSIEVVDGHSTRPGSIAWNHNLATDNSEQQQIKLKVDELQKEMELVQKDCELNMAKLKRDMRFMAQILSNTKQRIKRLEKRLNIDIDMNMADNAEVDEAGSSGEDWAGQHNFSQQNLVDQNMDSKSDAGLQTA